MHNVSFFVLSAKTLCEIQSFQGDQPLELRAQVLSRLCQQAFHYHY